MTALPSEVATAFEHAECEQVTVDAPVVDDTGTRALVSVTVHAKGDQRACGCARGYSVLLMKSPRGWTVAGIWQTWIS
jgi:hypothetical protein